MKHYTKSDRKSPIFPNYKKRKRAKSKPWKIVFTHKTFPKYLPPFEKYNNLLKFVSRFEKEKDARNSLKSFLDGKMSMMHPSNWIAELFFKNQKLETYNQTKT